MWTDTTTWLHTSVDDLILNAMLSDHPNCRP
jgi:hypothetical protein